MRQTTYRALPRAFNGEGNQFEEDAENGTILGIEFFRDGFTFVVMCVGHPVFDYSNGICASLYLKCLKVGERFIVDSSYQKVIDTTLYRASNPELSNFGSFVDGVLNEDTQELECPEGAITNTAFFVKYAIQTNTICIGDFIYQEIIKAEGLDNEG